MFSSKSFTVSGVTFRSVIDPELILVCGVERGSSLTLLHEESKSPAPRAGETVPTECSRLPRQRRWPRVRVTPGPVRLSVVPP